MDDDAFAAYVLNNAPRYHIETLEKIASALHENIASRRWGKPPGLEIGSNIEATMFGTTWTEHGTVVGMSPKGCKIERLGSAYTSRISYLKYAIRVLDEFEWNQVRYAQDRWEESYRTKRAQEDLELREDREAAVRDRESAARKPSQVEALNGTIDLYRGAFVHAFRPDWGTHEYGVVVALTPKKIILSNIESDWESRVQVSKHEIELLNDSQWAVVEREHRRRKAEYELAEKTRRTNELPDYSREIIPLDD